MKPKLCASCNSEYIPTGSKNICCTLLCRIKLMSKKTPNGCIEWGGAIGNHGYGVINVEGDALTVPRLIWQLINGEIKSGLFVCHHCDNRKCINPEHLFAGTPKENSMDMVKKGRHWIKGKIMPESYRKKLRVPKSREG